MLDFHAEKTQSHTPSRILDTKSPKPLSFDCGIKWSQVCTGRMCKLFIERPLNTEQNQVFSFCEVRELNTSLTSSSWLPVLNKGWTSVALRFEMFEEKSRKGWFMKQKNTAVGFKTAVLIPRYICHTKASFTRHCFQGEMKNFHCALGCLFTSTTEIRTSENTTFWKWLPKWNLLIWTLSCEFDLKGDFFFTHYTQKSFFTTIP